MNAFKSNPRARAFSTISLVLTLVLFGGLGAAAQNASARSPSDTVREFYRTMRAKKFREAFALSIFKPAIDPLSQAEFDDLRPDFERLANSISEKLQISGEQISGEEATVFVKIAGGEPNAEPELVTLIRRGGTWIVGDVANEAIVKQNGKEFFFNARLQAHHGEVQSMLQRIGIAQLAYAQQHNGLFGDMQSLIQSGLVPKDFESPDTIGYRFHIFVFQDGKSYSAAAEPVAYGRGGKLSFYMDSGGIKSGDMGGKPLLSGAAKP
jgi:hypothetical protein